MKKSARSDALVDLERSLDQAIDAEVLGDALAAGFAVLFPQVRILQQLHDRRRERLRIGRLDEQARFSGITASGMPPARVPTTA